MVQTKAQELRAAIQMRGWSNTTLTVDDKQDIVLNSRTGCRSWKGTKWGFISTDVPEKLSIRIDLPKQRVQLSEIAERLEMQIMNEDSLELSGIWIEHKPDRDTLHITISEHDLNETAFSGESKLIDFISDVRRMNCL
ncbi:hypothetical protein JCM19037_15 [Geomicrobium sp. JCM 19037]|uniref:hypothetical protein n=1 Tax=unclassified Geomicrobium TaxID=2628951 RepID=UPI00045F2C1B|nr:hypothetical protein [Geomicrobium sp. JCM 19037]GAK01828.1 hypothetical protein JCM19037_15 [Geomicrobium sp. JCM 19037]